MLAEFLIGWRFSNGGLGCLLYSCFHFSNWWRVLLVSAMLLMIRVNFGLSLTDAGVHPARQAMAMSTLYTCSIISFGIRMLYGVPVFKPQRFNLV
jgi:hypothetical protein